MEEFNIQGKQTSFYKYCPGTFGYNLVYKGKGKAIPLQAWTGPEGSRKLKLPDFMKIGTRR